MSWHSAMEVCPERRWVIIQTCQHLPLGSKWVGRKEPQDRQHKAAARGWAGRRTHGDSFLWLVRDEEQKRVLFLLLSTHQHKSKASSVPKRQSIFTPELLELLPQHSPLSTKWGWMPPSKTLSFPSQMPSMCSPSCPPCCHFSPQLLWIPQKYLWNETQGNTLALSLSLVPKLKSKCHLYIPQECSQYHCYLWFTLRHPLA